MPHGEAIEVIDTGYDFERQILEDKMSRNRKRIFCGLLSLICLTFIYTSVMIRSNGYSPTGLRPTYTLDTKFVLETDSPDITLLHTCKAVSYFNNEIYIGQDVGTPRIMIFDAKTGNYLRGFDDGHHINSIHGLHVDPVSETIWVVDIGNHTVKQFDLSGNLLNVIGEDGVSGSSTDPLRFDRPTDVMFDKNGFGYVADGEGVNNRIVVLHPDLTYKFALGSEGSGASEFSIPHSLAYEAGPNRLWVTDEHNNRIQVFDLDWLSYIGEWSEDDGCFMNLPKGLALDDKASNLYVGTTPSADALGEMLEIPLPNTDESPFEFTPCDVTGTWDVAASYYHNLVVTSDETLYAVNPFDGTCAVRYKKK